MPLVDNELVQFRTRTIPAWFESLGARDRASKAVLEWGDAALESIHRSEARAVWHTSVAKAAFLLRLYRSIDFRSVSSVVVATQHDFQIRALILAAQEAGKPTVYVPHAPVADNPQYADIPTPFAALRGPREVRFYSEHFGANAALLDVIGNPAASVLSSPMPTIDTRAPGVLALSPHPRTVLQRIIGIVRESGIANLIVAPHPRSNLNEIAQMIPNAWSLYSGPRTLDLLRTGPKYLLHHSSGVAWEAAALGIPTADIALDARKPNYPYLDDPVFVRLHDSDDVAAFALSGGSEATDRNRLRAYALEWCPFDGEASITRFQELLTSVDARFRSGRTERLVDGWANASSPARRLSWLPEIPEVSR